MQLAVLFRLAVDAGTAVSYRALAEDVWSTDAPENSRAALQSIVSRLRSQLPTGLIESTTGGYRLAVDRGDVDALRFSDLVAQSVATGDAAAASRALGIWTGQPWIPSSNFDWFERDLLGDRAAAIRLGGQATVPETRSTLPTSVLRGLCRSAVTGCHALPFRLPGHGGTVGVCCSVCFSLAAATSPNLQASLVAVFVVG